jgi:alanine dehydrogenase
MHKEAGEKRDFLPSLVKELAKYPVEVVLEQGYGQLMGIDPMDYIDANSKARFGSMEEVFDQDLVLVLRSPDFSQIELMRTGSVLMSMLHYETRPVRRDLLNRKGIVALSLDSIIDDNNQRLVENIKGTAWNGVKVAFEELSRSMGGFYDIDMSYITVTIMGTGTVAMHAAKASSKYGDPGITEVMEDRQIPGVLVQLAGRTITRDSGAMEAIISSTDILVDATKRYNPTKPIISNRFIGLLPQHSIILDLSADPYNFNVDPIQVKGIEGIPTGSLDQYVFYPEDKAYDTIDQYVKTAHRRTVVSCNAWPGITPARCMETYGTQISRFFPVLFSKAADELSPQSDNPDERALARSTIRYFENHVLPSQLQTTML